MSQPTDQPADQPAGDAADPTGADATRDDPTLDVPLAPLRPALEALLMMMSCIVTYRSKATLELLLRSAA